MSTRIGAGSPEDDEEDTGNRLERNEIQEGE